MSDKRFLKRKAGGTRRALADFARNRAGREVTTLIRNLDRQLRRGYQTSLVDRHPQRRRLNAPGGLPGGSFSELINHQSGPSTQLGAMARSSRSYTSTQTRRKKKRRGNQYAGAGHYVGAFKRPGKKLPVQKYPCVQKYEYQISAISGIKSSYIVHHTHPMKYCMRVLAMTMVHKYMRQSNVVIRAWTDSVGMVDPSLNSRVKPNLAVYAVYQNKSTGTTAVPAEVLLAQISSVDYYLQFADAISNGLVSLVTNFGVDLQILQIQWRTTAVAGNTLASRNWDASEIHIDLKGISVLNIQNRTLGGGGTAGDGVEASTTSIYANPLIGKSYGIKGSGPRFKWTVSPTGNSVQTFQPNADSESGYTAFTNLSPPAAAGTGASFTTQIRDVLRQPPHPKNFVNCTGVSTVRLEPGAIRKSRVADVVSKTLNQWLRHWFPTLKDATAVSNIESFAWNPTGKSILYGFEKVADMGGADPVVIAGENDGCVLGKMWFRKNRITAATNVAVTETLAPPPPLA